MSRRQRVAQWLAAHRMPTFAWLLYPFHGWRVSYPEFVGRLPPREDVDISRILDFGPQAL